MLDKLQTPVSVFATFEEEEGYQRALVYGNPQPQMKLLGENIVIEEASEPTDIIWENRHVKPSTRKCRMYGVAFIIFLSLLVSAGVIYFFTNKSNQLKNTYPPTDCSSLKKDYTNTKTDVSKSLDE